MRRRRPAHALLVDFDGVLRRYDRAAADPSGADPVDSVESRYGLAPGALLSAGMQWSRYLPAVIGHWTRQQWLDSIAEATGAPAQALAEWDSYRGYLDTAVLDFVQEVRRAGRPVALATNATDDLRDDLARFGLTEAFDAVVSSAEIGRHKPSPEFFIAACAAVDTPADECLFVDDTDRNVRGARAAGLPALRWSGPADLPYVRAALGL
jgi:putative hydrolase of the HAD superfamily